MKNTTKGVGVRLTRKSYRRKLIMFGFSVFMSLALTATGFAAWVLSKDAVVNTEGQVQVGAVTEQTIEITDIAFKKDSSGDDIDTFSFEPVKDDNDGRVRWDGENCENMKLDISWTITNYQYVGDFYVLFKLPVGIYNAIEAGYIALPEGVYEDDVTPETINGEEYAVLTMVIPNNITTSKTGDPVLNYTYTKNNEVVTIEFTMTLQFNWGEIFGGKNPGDYYDTDDTGKLVDYDTVKTTLNSMKTTMHGITYDDTFKNLSEAEQLAQYEANPIPTYWVEIHASVK